MNNIGLRLFLIIVFTFTGELSAASFRKCIIKGFMKILPIMHDVTVELEVGVNPRPLALTTTTDGTISVLLKEKMLPHELALKYPSYPEKKLQWEPLPWREKLIILNHATKNQDFNESRVITGLIMKSKVQVDLKKKVKFLKKKYRPG